MNELEYKKVLENAKCVVLRKVKNLPKTGMILGSGLSSMADELENKIEISYGEFDGFPKSSVKGHAGKLIFGEYNSFPIVLVSGRIHMYEGNSALVSVLPVALLKEIGVEKVIITNASGSVNKNVLPGDILLINDHINLTAKTPLVGADFIDMTEPYDLEERNKFKAIANDLSISIKEGVYVQLLGPSYETKAEVRYLGIIGGDCVGMSTVIETVKARSLDMKVLGISMISNMATGLSTAENDHEDVLKTVNKSIIDLKKILSKYLTN